ncbi:MAG TPA: tetraacyldisaccharide 4'-kinase [Fimbriimonadaceae bacterium]|nr:tetraacyldisaccharide 4'-kinase [Fimbriimonadaceae bacterium]HRJ97402.1 tetraacyldisaccharide 4'-kinase [Fimbriimonadaceae bacterium]
MPDWSTRPSLIRYGLYPASLLYAAGWRAYAAMYAWGLKKPSVAQVPVVCVGNLTVGGTGKTPLVVHLAGVLRDLGQEVVVSASGYGSPRAEAASVAPEGELNPRLWGDEPALLREALGPGVQLIVGRRRVLAARLCEEHFPRAVLLMDDGFQHLPLAKTVSIVLDPEPSNPFCLPLGPYREPRRSGAARADLVLPGRFHLRVGATEFADHPPEEADLLCAVGDPARLRRGLAEAGVHVVSERILPDHHPLGDPTVLQGLGEARPLVVTAKDWVKLRLLPLGDRKVVVASYRVSIEPADEFRSWLAGRLDEAESSRSGK